ncbi:MAG: putative phosphodiesterase [Ascidiaceihabitans sp.]|jgi:predicted phosphodiesterase
MGALACAFKAMRLRGFTLRHEHIGTLSGPVLAFGGPYSNFQATQALFEQAKKRDISEQNLICTGDVVAYCGAPSATVNLVRKSGCVVVAGNCEIQLAAGALDCGCGFEDGSACDLLSAGWFAHASKSIDVGDREWMGQRPDIVTFDHCGSRYAVLHGGLKDVARFVWSSSDYAVFEHEWAAVEEKVGPVDHIIAGHCGIPFVRETLNGRWINAGVIGMPPHNGERTTRYAVIEEGRIAICELAYDVAGAVADMASAGLTHGYEKSLISGVWPSEDVLPQDLRLPSLASG